MTTGKPSWADAPEWANYLAQDADCEWYWYENAPEPRNAWWVPFGGGRSAVAYPTNNPHWRNTLEERPPC